MFGSKVLIIILWIPVNYKKHITVSVFYTLHVSHLSGTRCLVVEYMAHGSLIDQLRKYRSELRTMETHHLLSPKLLAQFVVDICNGMKELERKKVRMTLSILIDA